MEVAEELSEEKVSLKETRPSMRVTWIEILVVVCVAVLPNWVDSLLNRSPDLSPAFFFSLSHGTHSIAIIAPVVYLMWRSGLGWRYYGLDSKVDLAAVGIFSSAVLVGLLVVPGLDYLMALLSGVEPTDNYRRFAPILPRSAFDWFVFSIAMMLNCIAEEFAMRGFLTTRLLDATKKRWLAICLPAALFGIYHLYQGWVAVFSITILGLFFGAVFIAARRLWALTLAHFMINFCIFIQLAWRAAS